MTVQDKFNQKETLLIVSDYPEKTKRGEKNYGIAWYTKETLEPIVKKYNCRAIVLAEKGEDNSPKLLADEKILLLRVFDPRRRSLFPVILRWLLTFTKIKRVYIHSEFCTNGGIKNFVLLPFFLILIRLSGRKITYFAHNVVTDFSNFAVHLNLPQAKAIIFLFNQSLKIYYFLLGILAEKIVVMDEVMKNRMEKFVSSNKVEFIPIWVKQKKYSESKETVRREMKIGKNDFVLLYFGFVTWYKGADSLIKNFRKLKANGKNLKLIVAGGPAYSLRDKKHYQNFYQKQIGEAKKDKRITLTGFVPEAQIGKYFTAADLVVFPYRGYLGSSGVLSHVLSYRKPFIVSQKMAEIFSNKDLADSLKSAGLKTEDLTFDFEKTTVNSLLLKLQGKSTLNNLRACSRILAGKRSRQQLLPLFYKKVFLGLSSQGSTKLVKEAEGVTYAINPAQN